MLTDAERRKVIKKWQRGQTKTKIADDLLCDWKTVASVLEYWSNTGLTSPPKQKKYRKLTPRCLYELHRMTLGNNSMDCVEYCDELYKLTGVRVVNSTMCEVLKDLRLSWKKLERFSNRANWQDQQRYVDAMREEVLDRCVWVDESGVNLHNVERMRGRSAIGQRAVANTLRAKGFNHSTIVAISSTGLVACEVIEGSYNRVELSRFAESTLLPMMNPYPGPRSVLVLDNCKTHYTWEFLLLVWASGVKIVFMPPYSPQYMPNELIFNTMKAFLRKNGKVLEAVGLPLAEIVWRSVVAILPSPGSCLPYIHKCGY